MSSPLGLTGPVPPPPNGGGTNPPPPPPPPDDKWRRIRANQDFSSMVCGALLYAVLLIAGAPTEVWILAIGAIALHFYWSSEEVWPHEWGALLFWGSAIRQLDNAPVYAFKPFFSVKREVRTVFQGIIGTPITDKKGEAIKIVQEGTTVIREEEPFRVTFPAIEDLAKLPPPQDDYPAHLGLEIPTVTPEIADAFKAHPLHGDITCDPQMVFLLDIKDYLAYLRVVPDIHTLSHNITAIAKATLQECAGRMTVGMLIAYNELVCRRITYRIEKLIGEPHTQVAGSHTLYWGINFQGIQISSMGLPRTLNEAMRSARSESYLRDQVITRSQGEKKKLENEGEGKAYARQKELEAEAIGAGALAKIANEPGGDLVLRLQAFSKALEEANVTLVPTGALSDMGSLISTTRAILDNSKKP